MALPEDPQGASAPHGKGALSADETGPESSLPAGETATSAPVTGSSHTDGDSHWSGETSAFAQSESISTAVIPATASSGGCCGCRFWNTWRSYARASCAHWPGSA